MIRLLDALTLARTKLRSHRVRTGITTSIAGLLFGLILLVIIVSQGFFDSAVKFSKAGLGDRTILTISSSPMTYELFNSFDHRDDPEFIAEIEKSHSQLIKDRKAAAKKFGVEYDPATEDPSPIGVDLSTKQKIITDSGLDSELVQKIVNERARAKRGLFSVEDLIKPYKSAKIIDRPHGVASDDGLVQYMENGKEKLTNKNRNMKVENYGMIVYDKKITESFVSSDFDPSRGEIPIIVTASTAQEMLGLKPLDNNATNEKRLNRLREIRGRVNEVVISFCYRNVASGNLMSEAVSQADEIKQNANNKSYVKPSIIYNLPSESSCGPVTIAKDTRTAAQKKQDKNRILFEKEIGTYLGEPAQRKIVARGVGISGDPGSMDETNLSGLISGILGSRLNYDGYALSIPRDLLEQLPAESRPAEIFESKVEAETAMAANRGISFDQYLVDFQDKSEARALLTNKFPMVSANMDGNYTSASQFASNTLLVDDMREFLTKILYWFIMIIGVVAAIILSAIIGRTVSESRKESAVFRSIGAKRIDIAMIYGIYAILLSIRTAIFALVLGASLSLVIEVMLSADATMAAKLAYALPDLSTEMHFIGLSWSMAILLGVVVLSGILASVIPIILSARRNPIKDMRADG